MLDGIYSEFLKLKRTGCYICVLLTSFICLYFSTMNKQSVTSLNWYGYFFNFEFQAFLIFYAMVIPNIVAMVFLREFSCNTASIEFAYPRGRFGAFINKFIISILMIAVIYIISYICIVLSGFILLKTPLTLGVLGNHLKVFLVSFAFQVALVPLAATVALLGKSMIISFVYSIALIIGNASYMLGVKYQEFIFSVLPAAPIAKFQSTICQIPVPLNLVITRLDIYLGIFAFLIGTTACLIFYRNANIH